MNLAHHRNMMMHGGIARTTNVWGWLQPFWAAHVLTRTTHTHMLQHGGFVFIKAHAYITTLSS
jgi:hypothetical protein